MPIVGWLGSRISYLRYSLPASKMKSSVWLHSTPFWLTNEGRTLRRQLSSRPFCISTIRSCSSGCVMRLFRKLSAIVTCWWLWLRSMSVFVEALMASCIDCSVTINSTVSTSSSAPSSMMCRR